MSDDKNFLQGCVDGDYLTTEIDDFVDEWHENITDVPLMDYLGFNIDEWELWISDDSSIDIIVAARKKNINVNEFIESMADYALAARSDNPAEAARAVEWLKKNGYI